MSFGVVAAASGFAGMVEGVGVQPLDMVKTRFHVTRGATNPTVYAALISIWKEGGILRFYRGFLPEYISIICSRGAMYSSYVTALGWFREQGARPVLAAVAAGAFSGIPETIVTNPQQVVKVRLQTNAGAANSFDCARQIFATSGINGFFAGASSTLGRNVVFNAAYFGIIYEIRDKIAGDKPANAVVIAGSAFVGGVLATVLNNPFDVCKSRIQAYQGPNKMTLMGTMRDILTKESPKALYKGFAPQSIKLGFGGALGLTTFEMCQRYLGS